MDGLFSHRRVCPLVIDPQPDCYCNQLTSQRIVQIVSFCCDRFHECVIYRRLQAGSQRDQ